MDKSPANKSPIWPTEEYAIRDFKSGCRRQMKLVATAPQAATGASQNARLVLSIGGNFSLIRRRPYEPSFRRIPAKIIDPATGASTCAFGSHRCVMYRGSLTRNAAMQVNHHEDRKKLIINCGCCHIASKILMCPVCLLIMRRFSKSGKDAVTVYNMRYVPAWRRSG